MNFVFGNLPFHGVTWNHCLCEFFTFQRNRLKSTLENGNSHHRSIGSAMPVRKEGKLREIKNKYLKKKIPS